MRSSLKEELETAGLLSFHPVRIYLKAAALLAITAAIFAAFFVLPHWWARLPLFMAGVAVSTAAIMLGHESGHGAISKRPLINDPIGYLMFPLFGGLSLDYWRSKHGLHHAYVNVEGMDPDIALYPFALSRKQRAPRFGFAWIVQHMQGFAFWPLTLFTSLTIRYDSLRFVFGAGRKAKLSVARVADMVCLLGHYMLWLAVPMLVFHLPVLAVLAFYLAWSLLGGLLLGAVFVPAHTTRPIYSSYSDHYALQLETTQNLLTNRLFSWMLIGLDHQVEHHLFPRMSHLNMRAAALVVRAHCARNELPYQEQGWGAALLASTVALHGLPGYDPPAQPV